ncbi:hypothetical protein BHUM_02775 [Candidatus Burkholderia humilis]|nr:hypothetical protein BHUM_02775 [Candidatus Burkholderia humilis]
MATELRLFFGSMGDQVAVSLVPEAYFARYGERLFYTSELIWVFKHNPFIDLKQAEDGDTQIVAVPDSRYVADIEKYVSRFNGPMFGSQSELVLNSLDLDLPKTRHPRLYVYEDVDIVPHKVVGHTTGSNPALQGEEAIRSQLGEDEVRVMSDDVLAAIARNYKDWMIVQVGAADDKPIADRNVIDRRGRPV